MLFQLIPLLLLIWWIYERFICKKIIATVIGIKSTVKNSAIEQGHKLRMQPYAVYTPIISCQFNGGLTNDGILNSTQNYIPENWIPGSKLRVVRNRDKESFSEKNNYLGVVTIFVATFPVSIMLSTLPDNLYSLTLTGIMFFALFYSIFIKINPQKLMSFISRGDWKKYFIKDKEAFIQRKKEQLETEKKQWRKLSGLEISTILKEQYSKFISVTVPLLLALCVGLGFAVYRLWDGMHEHYRQAVRAGEDVKMYAEPTQFFLAVFLAVIGIYIFIKTLLKIIRLPEKMNFPQVF